MFITTHTVDIKQLDLKSGTRTAAPVISVISDDHLFSQWDQSRV